MTPTATGIDPGPLPPTAISPAGVAGPGCGAVASFVGVVRDNHDGKAVTHLEYECYEAMAAPMLEEFVDEVRIRWGDELRVRCRHGHGRMEIGDASVAIHVAAPHRDAAFAACRHLIERIKEDLPVWKEEFYADGTSRWLKGS